MKKIQKEVENMLVCQIRNIMIKIDYPYLCNYTDNEYMDMIQKLSLLTNELLSSPGAENKLERLAKRSFINGQNNKQKYQVFKMLRNLLVHFPFFEKWEDIYINETLLNWNERKGGQIKKFFNDNQNIKLDYTIFMNHYGQWDPEWTVNILVPKIYVRKKVYLNDILSLKDALWTFCIINYYLEAMGYKVDNYCNVSL